MSFKSTPSEWIKDLSLMEKNVYVLKLLRDSLQQTSDVSRDAALYGSELAPPQMPERPKCKIKSVPERPEQDKNSKVLKFSKYIIVGSVALALLGVLLYILSVFKGDSLQGGASVKAAIILFAVAIIAAAVAGVGILLEKQRYNEELNSWESVKLQINEQNQQEIIRCQNEDNKVQEEYAQKLSEYEKIKLVYTLKESVKSQIFDLAKSKVHSLVVLAEKQLAYVYNVTNLVPAELRRYDAVIKMSRDIECEEASGGEAAIRNFIRGTKEGKLPVYLSDFTENIQLYSDEMAVVCDFLSDASAEVSKNVVAMEVFSDAVISKSVNFATQTVNNSILAVEFAKTYEDSSVAVLANAAARTVQEVAEQYLV